MTMELLREIAQKPLPCTVTEERDIDLIRVLRAAGYVAAFLQVQADQVDHALARFFQLGAQEFAAKVARNLHHALGGLRVDGVQRGLVDHAMLHAMRQRLFKKRPCVVQ